MWYLQSEEDKDLCPNACFVSVCVDAKGLKCREDYENGSPAVVE